MANTQHDAKNKVRSIRAIPQSPRRVTPREVSVLKLSYGTNAQIAAELGISIETVRTHWKSINLKLGTPNRTAAALVWLEREAA